MGVTERDREFSAQILEDFSSFEEGIENQEKLAQWIRNVRHNAASVPDAAATPIAWRSRHGIKWSYHEEKLTGPSAHLFEQQPLYAAPAQAVSEPTEEMIDAAAREIWNDRDARHGGAWDSRDAQEICVIQTKATAHAALKAALSITRPQRETP